MCRSEQTLLNFSVTRTILNFPLIIYRVTFDDCDPFVGTTSHISFNVDILDSYFQMAITLLMFIETFLLHQSNPKFGLQRHKNELLDPHSPVK